MVASPDAAPERSPFALAALRGTPVNRLCRVIDVHGHLGHPGLFDCAVTDPAGVLAIMDRVGIDVLCTSHLLAILSDVSRGNDLMAEAVRAHPSRFIGYAVVNPNYSPDAIDAELERCFSQLGMRGIKTHIAFHDYAADGPAYQRVYEFAAEHKLPLLAHSLGPAPVAARIARDYPEAKLIIAHVGGGFHGRAPDDVVALAGEYENVYVDLAFSLTGFGGLESLVRYVPVEKILFASDICFQQATHQIGTVLMADISDDDKRKILGGNAAKVFDM